MAPFTEPATEFRGWTPQVQLSMEARRRSPRESLLVAFKGGDGQSQEGPRGGAWGAGKFSLNSVAVAQTFIDLGCGVIC